MSRPRGYYVPPLAPCAWCGRPCRGRDEAGEPRCAEGHGCGVPRPRVVVVRPPWVPDVGTMTEEERLTVAETCAPMGDLPLRDWQRGVTR